MSEPIPREAHAYYDGGVEAGRLFRSHGLIELARTQEIILRHLPPPPCTVLDVGGGPGAYACWLASRGYRVTLIDAVPLHVEQARAASARQPDAPIAALDVGDARELECADASARAVLLLGPLYHLTERPDRLVALREARRVLEPGGLLFAAAVGRYASLLSGVAEGLLGDPDFAAIVAQDLRDGQHRNPTAKDYFTTTFFHRPDELRSEVIQAGFDLVELVGVEGPAWLLPDLERRWTDPEERERLLQAARAVEREPTLLGLHPHLLAVARRPLSEAG
ncbi:MAG TPA: methyltransferase domain-containing protein [Methylomirabilota bacterium]